MDVKGCRKRGMAEGKVGGKEAMRPGGADEN